MMAFGDSKTATGTWQAPLATAVGAALPEGRASIYTLAVGGATVAYWRSIIDASLAAITTFTHIVLVDLGVNDITAGLPPQATWEANLAYILDAFHTKWPLAHVYVARSWARGQGTDSNTIAGWSDNVMATRATWASAGQDERVWLEGGDNGVTNTIDGVHFSAAGNTACAAAWAAATGY